MLLHSAFIATAFHNCLDCCCNIAAVLSLLSLCFCHRDNVTLRLLMALLTMFCCYCCCRCLLPTVKTCPGLPAASQSLIGAAGWSQNCTANATHGHLCYANCATNSTGGYNASCFEGAWTVTGSCEREFHPTAARTSLEVVCGCCDVLAVQMHVCTARHALHLFLACKQDYCLAQPAALMMVIMQVHTAYIVYTVFVMNSG